MSSQQALAFPAAYVGGEAWDAELEAIRSAVKHLGPKEVAWELNVSPQQLSDSLNERERKNWHGRWSQTVLAMLVQRRDETSAELLGAIARARLAVTRFTVSAPIDLSADDVAHGYRNAAPDQQAAIARILGRDAKR